MRWLALAVLGLLVTTGFVQDEPVDRVGYGLGYRLGGRVRQNLRLEGVGADPQLVVRGFSDGLGGVAPQIEQKKLQEILAAVHREMQSRLAQRLLEKDPEFRRVSQENLARGQAFQEAFGKRQGVVTTQDGLQYQVVTPGDGPSPTETDVVNVSYRFLRLDGTEIAVGDHELVALDDVIKGGKQVLQKMKVGATWFVAIPPQLAFGAVGSYPEVGPNETIVGRIELHGIEPKEPAP